ncbi:helix-turn-helix domain-containing protein [uncultured Methylobacterium sp.]|uniref:helix-turn-helix domain-containing protein n=1 Tax=uncultured Methylobacterium sp. TaxID=157278 RepID=UPI0035C9FCB5
MASRANPTSSRSCATSPSNTCRGPTGAIALDLGYADAAHFSRAFQSLTGMPPRVWRQAATGFRSLP